MRARPIGLDQARLVATILTDDCGWRPDAADRGAFLAAISGFESPCDEYRFQGGLGFGGKFRNNGNRGGVPYVDCYPEDETPERRAVMERANGRLAAVFATA